MDHYADQYDFHFDVEVEVKDTTLLKCSDCNTVWLLENTSSNRYCHKIYSVDQIERLKTWLITDTSASHLKKAAEQIGTSSTEFQEYPCKATLKSGEIRDLCILTKWTHDPRVSWPSIRVQNYVYASDILTIQPSDYALALDHRIAMRNAQEEHYRDYVHLVLEYSDQVFFKDQGCKTYYMDSNFLRYRNVKGSEIKSVTQDLGRFKAAREKDDLTNAVTYILFDRW